MLTQWWDESYQYHWSTNTDIDVRERKEQRSLMKRSDLRADSMSLKCLRKKDWKSRYVHHEECTEVESIHSTS